VNDATPPRRLPWTADPPRLGRADAAAVVAWTTAIGGFFWRAVTLRGALFYFDITEINFPYRDFFARELQAGRLSRWCPGLYCGLPLYSESQAGYFHPLKYLVYPWMEPWQAFNLDTVGSIWLVGLATYGWLRRHVGPVGAATGAAAFALSGFTWAHLVHTSMINALVSVPLAIWALECSFDGGRLRGAVLGGLALACQVFAGHLQDAIFTTALVGLYGLYRAVAVERGARARGFVLLAAGTLIGLGVAVSAVQWIPSKELLDRSPRAGGLAYDELTYGSWHPELLPTMVVREAYGTRARDTDWMDGFYPYHEMNTYLGLTALGLAAIGAAAWRDRWVGFWVLLAIVAGWLMLGRFTALFDLAHRLPVAGSTRIPVRFHVWMALAVAALAAVGADRLSRPGVVRLRGAVAIGLGMILASLPILAVVYSPIFEGRGLWNDPALRERSGWLVDELIGASGRSLGLALAGWLVADTAARSTRPGERRAIAALLPVIIATDLLSAHRDDSPTVDPAYWTEPPASARAIAADPGHQRIYGLGQLSAGEPGYASKPVDFLVARDTLAWSLAPTFGLRSSAGETPMIPRRWKAYMDATRATPAWSRVEGVSHVLTGQPGRIADWPPGVRAGRAYVHRNPRPLPRARLVGRPIYATGEPDAARLVAAHAAELGDRIIVEDSARPLPADARPIGSARIVAEEPERMEIVTRSADDAYLMLADTFDPGWSAAIDGRPAAVVPADLAFRAVYVPAGDHTVVFAYRPAGFAAGLGVTTIGLTIVVGLVLLPRRFAITGPPHGDAGLPGRWPAWLLAAVVVFAAGSAIGWGPAGPRLHSRWAGSLHRFTWAAGIEAMRSTIGPRAAAGGR